MLRPARVTRGPEPGLQKPAMALHVRGGVETRRLVTLACPWRVRAELVPLLNAEDDVRCTRLLYIAFSSLYN